VEIESSGADVVVDRNGQRIAIELETGKSDHEANVRRDLGSGFDQVIVVWLGSKALHTFADERSRQCRSGPYWMSFTAQALELLGEMHVPKRPPMRISVWPEEGNSEAKVTYEPRGRSGCALKCAKHRSQRHLP